MAENNSYFDGRLIQMIGWGLLGGLVTLCTCGILYPLAVVWMQKWETRHTVINNHRLVFDGNAFQLLGKWMLWLLLTIVTCGIFSFWLTIKMKKWVTKHTHFATE